MAEVVRTLDEPGRPTLEVFTASDGYRWFYRRFAPSNEARARLIIIHGIQSHGGWYTRSCAKLAAAGHEVFFLDRRGCGLNRERRGDLPGFRRALDDIAEFLQALPDDAKPKILTTISWGGKLGAALPYRHPGLIDGLAMLCPGIVSKVRPAFLTRARIAMARVFRPGKMFPIPLNDPKLFTASAEWQRFIAEDELGLRQATARMLFSSFALDIYLRRAWKKLTIPILLLLAEHDDIIENSGVKAYLEKAPSADKQVLFYPGAHHTLEFEPEGHPYLIDLLKWIAKQSHP